MSSFTTLSALVQAETTFLWSFWVGYQCSTEVCVSVSVCVCSDDVDLATDPDLVMWSALLVTM